MDSQENDLLQLVEKSDIRVRCRHAHSDVGDKGLQPLLHRLWNVGLPCHELGLDVDRLVRGRSLGRQFGAVASFGLTLHLHLGLADLGTLAGWLICHVLSLWL